MTQAGQRLLPYARQVAQLLQDARRVAVDDGIPAGPLTVGSLESTAAVRLSPVLSTYVAQYPDVDVTLRTGTTAELVEAVLDHRLEGAFVCGPVEHPELTAETMFHEQLAVVAPPGPASLDKSLTGRDLKIIVLRAGCSYRERFEDVLARRGIVGYRGLEFGTLEAIISCVSAGLGFALLPCAFVSLLREGRVSLIELPGGEGSVETVFLRRRDGFVSSALRAFIEVARPAPAHIHAAV